MAKNQRWWSCRWIHVGIKHISLPAVSVCFFTTQSACCKSAHLLKLYSSWNQRRFASAYKQSKVSPTLSKDAQNFRSTDQQWSSRCSGFTANVLHPVRLRPLRAHSSLRTAGRHWMSFWGGRSMCRLRLLQVPVLCFVTMCSGAPRKFPSPGFRWSTAAQSCSGYCETFVCCCSEVFFFAYRKPIWHPALYYNQESISKDNICFTLSHCYSRCPDFDLTLYAI